jgi:putative PIN family toxin of toxin-antitoxin system
LRSRASIVAVIDTNVVVSGLLTTEANAPTSRILDGMLERQFNFLLSNDLIAEYRAVLLRARVKKLHRLRSEEVDQILTEIAANAIVREPSASRIQPPDEGDRHLWDLLDTHRKAVLVTGDRRLLRSAHFAGRIMTPREFVDITCSGPR